MANVVGVGLGVGVNTAVVAGDSVIETVVLVIAVVGVNVAAAVVTVAFVGKIVNFVIGTIVTNGWSLTRESVGVAVGAIVIRFTVLIAFELTIGTKAKTDLTVNNEKIVNKTSPNSSVRFITT